MEVPEDSNEARLWLASKREAPPTNPLSLSDQTKPYPMPEQSAPQTTSSNDLASSSAILLDPGVPSTISSTTPNNTANQPLLSAAASDRLIPPRLDSSSSITNQFSDLKTGNGSAAGLKPPAKPRPKTGGGFGALLKAKPKKLSTLEKSRMDWNSHVDSAGNEMKDELEANRRGGGYIEKVEFLGRVSERVEETLDNAKGSKRKR